MTVAPGEHWFQGKLEFMLSQRGKPLLVHDGHTFGIQYVRKDKKYWQCNLSRKFNCKARVTTTDTGEIIVTNNEHCHTEIRQHLRKDYQRNKVMMNALLNLSSMRRHSVGNLNSLSNLKQCLPSMLAVAEHCSEPSILDLAKASNITTTTNTTCTEDIENRNSSTDDYTAHDLSRTAAKIENEFIRQHKHDNDEDSDNDSPLDCGMRGTSTSDF